MAIIRQYHADTDTTYVYESTSYWDAEKRQSRSKRKLLGKIDPETGEIIPTGGRGRRKKNITAESSTGSGKEDLSEQIREMTLLLQQKETQISALELENRRLKETLKKAAGLLEQCSSVLDPFSEV